MIVCKIYVVLVSLLLALVYGCAFISVDIQDGPEQTDQRKTIKSQTMENETNTAEILN